MAKRMSLSGWIVRRVAVIRDANGKGMAPFDGINGGVMKKGESFAWSASLLHGGSKVKDPSRTRKSQVTHYFLTGAKKYWVPRKSAPSIDKIKYKCAIPACTPTKGAQTACATRHIELWKARKWVDFSKEDSDVCTF